MNLREPRRRLSPSEKYELFVSVLTGQATQRKAAARWQVDRSTAQLRESKKKLATVVKASGTNLTGLFGVGPVIAAIVIGDAGTVTRFPSRDHYAAWNGTAPIEVSSDDKKIHWLSLRGNRRVNYAIHIAAVTQIRHKHSHGRAYYDKKIAEGKTPKEGAARPQAAESATPSTPASRPTTELRDRTCLGVCQAHATGHWARQGRADDLDQRGPGARFHLHTPASPLTRLQLDDGISGEVDSSCATTCSL